MSFRHLMQVWKIPLSDELFDPGPEAFDFAQCRFLTGTLHWPQCSPEPTTHVNRLFVFFYLSQMSWARQNVTKPVS